VLQAIGKISIPVMAAFVGAVIKIVVGFVLIAHPDINIYGAIIGTTVCYFVAAWINCYFLRKFTGARLDFMGIVIKPIIASVAMAMACFTIYHLIFGFLPNNAVATISSILVGMIVYGAFMSVIRGFKEEDLHILPKGQRLASALKSRGII